MLRLGRSKTQTATRRPVPLRMRADLIVQKRIVAGKLAYFIKDPITLSHHQLWQEEYALLKLLNGKRSVSDIKELFEDQFERKRLDYSRLERLHAQFYRSGLLVSDAPGQGKQLAERDVRHQSNQRNKRIQEWFAIRFRGINPDRMLEYCDTKVGWFFSRNSVVLLAFFLVGTLFFMAVKWQSLLVRLPEINDYLTAKNIVWLFLTFTGLKVVHELGHALACKHFGAECNEMGIMFLVFAPCLYCDITDSWMIESKWKRALVAFAGILSEMTVAAVCAWIWWASYPGLVHSVCFNAMLIGGVATLAFNGNPLLRYDGYFILSDLLETPNLWQQSKSALRNSFRRFFFRPSIGDNRETLEPSTWFLWLYGFHSSLYRWVLSIAVLVIVYKVFQSFRLELVGASLVACISGFAIIRASGWIASLAANRRSYRNLRKGRVAVTSLVTVVLLASILLVPIPAQVVAPVLINTADAVPIVVLVAGRLIECKSEGSEVSQGDMVARIDSADLRLELAARRGQLSQQRARLAGLESRRSQDVSVAAQIPTVREAIAGLEYELQRLEVDAEQLILRAPSAGIIIAPESQNADREPASIEYWSGTPLQSENVGAHLTRGTQLCKVGRSGGMEGTVYLTQSQVELVRSGQLTATKTPLLPNATFRGKVLEIASTSFVELPKGISLSGTIPARTLRDGRFESLNPIYQAKISLDASDGLSVKPRSHDGQLFDQALGTVAIRIDAQSIGSRIARLFYETISVDPRVQQKSSP